MGVPALFRWLSKKYPKIVASVVEDQPVTVQGENGEEEQMPVDMAGPNPNGEEFDNLYLDMNGIVHPCTHPEGKPAPKTEEDMMHEVFLYTDRVVSMVRPRKLLVMAIDGVAPRAKMNQQRSRRFRSAQEAATKEEDRLNAIAEWEAMGKEVSDEYKNEKGWDSNAITPGTPFMDLLAKSLRYWVAKKLNEDPGWAGLQVIISDASVPGEGEHKIMDFIRRQRSHPSHDPNTKHVIYGLDADLIMLSLATHEPHFKVLREDVFAQDKKGRGCHTCGQPGHHSSQCTGKPKELMGGTADEVQKPSPLKPFIFLDVAVLREYLAVELSAPVHNFPFDLERAIDDWVFLIFFVGNDFLPHLPSLEIREGAIDTLMNIWKSSLEQMGGYLAEHGKVNLKRAQIILDQLALREDDIFRKRREAEERQDRNEKRRKIEQEQRNSHSRKPIPYQNSTPMGSTLNGTEAVQVRPLAPSRPAESALGANGLPAKPNWVPEPPAAAAADISSMMSSNSSIVANRRAIRMANLSAAEMIKAELAAGENSSAPTTTAVKEALSAAEKLKKELAGETTAETEDDVKQEAVPQVAAAEETAADAEESEMAAAAEIESPRGTKRTADEAQIESGPNSQLGEDEDEDDDVVVPPTAQVKVALAPLKHMGNNVVEQDDTVRLFEPGYKERYYRQKFGVELSDVEFRRSVMKSYVEGLCWVLEYYYQGTPSWQWYYPHHFAPFASDFTEMETLEISFTLGQPFKPYEQLMGVFPAASRVHLPEPFQPLMTSSDSPIIDFYPEEFEIDMNGKKMLWQGVALLPFIDPTRLLEAMATRYPELSEFENNRNLLGSDTLFVSQEHSLYDYLEGLYTKRKITQPIPLDTKRSKGIAGSVLPDPSCIPNATYDSPLPSLPDLAGDRSISASFQFPPQKTPHRSILLPGVKFARATLTAHDKDSVRRGGGERFEGGGLQQGGFHAQNRGSGPGFAKLNRGGDRNGPGGYQPQQHSGYNQHQSAGNGQYQQHSRDPYGGYQHQPQQHQQPAYHYQPPPFAVAPQTSYRSLPPGMSGYRPPAAPQQAPYGAYQPPHPPSNYGGYGGPPHRAGPPAGNYGGYGQAAPAPPMQGGYGGYGQARGAPPQGQQQGQHRRY